jgi:hypothetical protein
MQVQIWIESLNTKKLILGMSYADTQSNTKQEAAERAWHITNGANTLLEGDDLLLRTRWEALHPGMAVSVNDIVIVDGIKLKCLPGGWHS